MKLECVQNKEGRQPDGYCRRSQGHSLWPCADISAYSLKNRLHRGKRGVGPGRQVVLHLCSHSSSYHRAKQKEEVTGRHASPGGLTMSHLLVKKEVSRQAGIPRRVSHEPSPGDLHEELQSQQQR